MIAASRTQPCIENQARSADVHGSSALWLACGTLWQTAWNDISLSESTATTSTVGLITQCRKGIEHVTAADERKFDGHRH